MALSAVDNLASRCNNKIDEARLKAAAAPHSEDWLNAISISSVGLRLSDEAIRVAMGHRLGSPTCHPHTCVCEGQVDARGLHGMACKKRTPRHIRHSMLNDILWRAVKKAQVPACKEPVCLFRIDAKRPDGATLVPWAREKPMTWDVTVPDTYAQSRVNDTSIQAGTAADSAAAAKKAKYTDIANTYMFIPVAIETGRPWNVEAIQFIQEIGRRITLINGESRETEYIFQRISIAIQKGNHLAYQSTFQTESNF